MRLQPIYLHWDHTLRDYWNKPKYIACAGKDEGVDWISQEDGITIGGQRSTVCYCAGANVLLEEKQQILNINGGGIIRAVVDDEIFHSAEEGTNRIRSFNETEGVR